MTTSSSMKKRGGKHVSIRRVVDGVAVLRAARLLDMMYKPSEIAQELKINKRSIYDILIPLGLPHERDEHGHIWLHGITVREWLQKATRGPKHKLSVDEMFCLRCFTSRSFKEARLVRDGKMVRAQATCPVCRSTMNKGVGKRIAVKLVRLGIVPEEDLSIYET